MRRVSASVEAIDAVTDALRAIASLPYGSEAEDARRIAIDVLRWWDPS